MVWYPSNNEQATTDNLDPYSTSVFSSFSFTSPTRFSTKSAKRVPQFAPWSDVGKFGTISTAGDNNIIFSTLVKPRWPRVSFTLRGFLQVFGGIIHIVTLKKTKRAKIATGKTFTLLVLVASCLPNSNIYPAVFSYF